MSVRTNTLSALAVALLAAAASAQPPAPTRLTTPQRFVTPAPGPVGWAFDFVDVAARGADNREVATGVRFFGDYVPTPPAAKPCVSQSLTGGFGPFCAPFLPRLRTPESLTPAVPGVLSIGARDLPAVPPMCPPCPTPDAAQPPAMVPPVAPAEPVPQMAEPTPPVTAPAPRVNVPALGPLGVGLDYDFSVVRAPGDNRQVFNFEVVLFGGQRACAPPAMTCGAGGYCPPVPPQPMTARPNRPDLRVFSGYDFPRAAAEPVFVPAVQPVFVPSVQPAGAFDVIMPPPVCPVCPPCPLPKIEPNPLLGTWYREMPGVVIVATFTHDELKLCVTQMADGLTVVLTVTAHYALTKDGLVFGAITGADAEVKGSSRGELAGLDSAMELASAVQRAVDAPFSFRVKATSAGVMVSRMMCATLPNRNEMDVFGGMFKPAKDGKVPAPTPVENRRCPTDGSRELPPPPPVQRSSAALPDGQVVERVGVDFSAPAQPPVLTPPAPAPGCEACPSKIPYTDKLFKNVGPAPVPQPPTSCLPPAPAPADGTKQMAGDAFNQLLQQSGVTRPAGGMTLPGPKYLEHYPQYFPPAPAFPQSRELASQEGPVRPAAATVPAPKPVAVGTWTRDVAGKLCVVKVEADHLTLTVHDAQEVDGKVSTVSLTVTADYHLARDGQTAVGLITGADVSFEGEFPAEDTRPFFEMLSDLQKALEGKPFALTFRPSGDALAIGSVRFPPSPERMDVSPATYLSGRYKAAGDKVPKPKPVKVQPEPRPGFVPSPQEQPGGAPTGDLIPSPALPPARVVPPMTPPLPPGAVGAVPLNNPDGARRTRELPGQYSSDPNVRMQSLLYDGQDSNVRQLGNEWRRLWFNDQPKHLTPERIHGGIY